MQIRCADYGYLLSECETSPSPRECLTCMWEECCCCWRVFVDDDDDGFNRMCGV